MIIVGIVYVSCFLSRRVAYKDHPDYQEYFKMLKMHQPRPDVEKKMNEKGKDPKVLDTPDAIVPGSGARKDVEVASGVGKDVELTDDGGDVRRYQLLRKKLKYFVYVRLVSLVRKAVTVRLMARFQKAGAHWDQAMGEMKSAAEELQKTADNVTELGDRIGPNGCTMPTTYCVPQFRRWLSDRRKVSKIKAQLKVGARCVSGLESARVEETGAGMMKHAFSRRFDQMLLRRRMFGTRFVCQLAIVLLRFAVLLVNGRN